MSRKDVIYTRAGVIVRNRRHVTYYRFANITDASKLRLFRLAVAIRPPAKKKRSRGNSWGGRRGQRQVSAAAVLARLTGEAIATLVERVNSEVAE